MTSPKIDFQKYFDKLSLPSILLLTYTLIALTGGADYWTGPEISFSIFYVLPIAFATWFANRRQGFIAALVSSAVWLTLDLVGDKAPHGFTIPFWNAVVRLAFFALTVALIAKIKELNFRLVKLFNERTSAWVREVAERQKTERSLYESEGQFRSLIESLSEAYYVCDVDGRIKYASEEMFRRSGYPEKELIGMSYVEFLHPEDRRRIVRFYLGKNRSGAEEVSCQFRVRVRNGESFWVHQVTRIVRDKQGKILEYHNILRDISKQKKTEEQNLLLAHAVASTSQAVTITDEQNRFIFVNKAFLGMYGYTEEEILGTTPDILLSKKRHPQMAEEIVERTKQGGWSGGLINQKKNGDEFPIFLTTSPIKNNDGKIIGLLGVTTDITEQRHVQQMIRESEIQFRTVVETMREGLVRVDNTQHIEYANNRFCEIIGCDRKKLISFPSFEMLLQKEDLEFFRQECIKLKKGEASQFEIRLRKKSNAYLWVQISAAAITDTAGAVIGSLFVISDISGRKRAESSLLKAEARLEKLFQSPTEDSEGEIETAGGTARIMGDFAQRIDNTTLRMGKIIKHLLSFSSLASHELRTPLAIIRNQLEDSMQRKTSAKKFRSDVASVYDEILRLQQTVSDLLAIGSMLAGTFKLMLLPLDFYTFLKNFYDEALLLTRDKNISIVFARGHHATIMGDENMLRLVMFNLLDNAIKYAPRGGRIHLGYTIQDQQIIMNFSDNGPGIPPEERKRIFDPFTRGSKTGSIGGTGLGLTLVKLVVEAHNGTISVESEMGKRTTFLISLPIAQPNDSAEIGTNSLKDSQD
jgi:PAS domain S-box-containing protein